MVKIITAKWKETFLEDVKNKIEYAEKEYDNYIVTGHIIHLQQAGNKLFSAVENYLMLKYDRRVKSYVKVQALSTNNADRLLLSEAVQLHYFYYNAELQMDRYDAEVIYNEVKNKIKRRVSTIAQ